MHKYVFYNKFIIFLYMFRAPFVAIFMEVCLRGIYDKDNQTNVKY